MDREPLLLLLTEKEDFAQRLGEALSRKFGLAMLDHSALLIAVWDGAPSAGRGGTREIIEAAARRGMPIILLDAQGEAAPQLRWREMEAYQRLSPAFDDLPPAARRFYADNKRVANARAKAELGWRPAYPTYREGLASLITRP